eukprot:346884-Alexandrium_andersonii.AAC.1
MPSRLSYKGTHTVTRTKEQPNMQKLATFACPRAGSKQETRAAGAPRGPSLLRKIHRPWQCSGPCRATGLSPPD